MTRVGMTILLFGGGRWGRVHATNLFRILSPRDRLLWVSQHNFSVLQSFVGDFDPAPTVNILSSTDAALIEKPDAAIVVTASESHFRVAELLLKQRIHTFVEKPLALSSVEAESLIRVAHRHGCILAVGLHLLSAKYLSHFKMCFSGRKIAAITVTWLDPEFEIRYGEMKRTDVSTPLVQDVYPHIWSVVYALTQCGTQIVEDVEFIGDTLSLRSVADGVLVSANLGRRAKARKRRVDVSLQDGGTASLEFTAEPGEIVVDGVGRGSDPSWETTPTPLVAEVQTFLDQTRSSHRNMRWPHLAMNCIDSVFGAEKLMARLSR